MRVVLAAVGALALGACSVAGVRDGYDQPDYRVEQTLPGGVEIRRYAPRLAAETTVDGEGRDARNRAFRLLFNYIAGDNRPGGEIAMTVPVETQGGREIAMTVPVETVPAESAGADGRLTMRFFLPPEFTEENAPPPANQQVRIVMLPAVTVAAIRFTGLGGRDAEAEQRDALAAALAESGWQPAGAAAALYYDPPWTIPFLRRNEITVPVTRGG